MKRELYFQYIENMKYVFQNFILNEEKCEIVLPKIKYVGQIMESDKLEYIPPN